MALWKAVEHVALERSIHNLIESRLRAARIYVTFSKRRKGWPSLWVKAYCFSSNECEVSVRFYKELHDRASGEISYTATGGYLSVARTTPERMADAILSEFSKLMDSVLSTYLRVNEEACDKRFTKP